MARISTEIDVQRQVKDGWFVYTSDQLPGLYVANPKDQVAYNDALRAVQELLRLDLGLEVEIAHKVSYEEFFTQVSSGETECRMLRQRTVSLRTETETVSFTFVVQRAAHASISYAGR